MRVGVLMVVAASGPVGATSSAPAPAVLAPVETAQFKLVPPKVVRAEPAPEPAAARRNATVPALPAVATPPAEPTLDALLRANEQQQASKVTPSARGAPMQPSKATLSPSVQAKAAPTAAAAVARVPPAGATRKPAAADAAPVMSGEAFAALTRVLLTRDHGAAPFVIIDKRNAHMWLFDADGQSRGDSAVLLGLARGDDTVPGIGDKPLARIRDGERTTPAGRFVAEPGRNARGDDVFWVDYDAAVSMHRVHDVQRGEQRLRRLASPSAADNRISYGCINVPVAFYDQALMPLIGGRRAVVYLLPETRPLETIFEAGDRVSTRQGAKPTSKGPSWLTPSSTVSGSSNPSTTL
jgi:hypothetical protein